MKDREWEVLKALSNEAVKIMSLQSDEVVEYLDFIKQKCAEHGIEIGRRSLKDLVKSLESKGAL